jgi:hypothetical protein
MLPTPITPSQLKILLTDRGMKSSERTLKDWRLKGLLPPLISRGRGRGKGKQQFWRSPKLLEQAVVVSKLVQLKYPNDEARLVLYLFGFRIAPKRVRSAWLSRLGKMQARTLAKTRAIIKRPGNAYCDAETQASALVENYVRIFAAQFGLRTDLITQLAIDLFRLAFEQRYIADDNVQPDLIEVFAEIMKIGAFTESQLSDSTFEAVIKFIQQHMSFEPVSATMRSATDEELQHAIRRWRKVLYLARFVLPSSITEGQVAIFLSAGFGKLLLPTFIQFIRNGRLHQIDRTLSEIGKFNSRHKLWSPFQIVGGSPAPSGVPIAELKALLKVLADIWDWRHFPFVNTT